MANTPTCRIVIMAKAPVPGLCKTRLIPALGPGGAARLAARMLLHTVKIAFDAHIGPVEICAAPSASHPAWQSIALPASLQWSEQGEGDLGARMAAAVRRTLARGEHALLIGTDCPALDAASLQSAAQALTTHDAALVPTADGGYALLSLARFHAGIFANMPWSTPAVAQQTLERFAKDGWRVQLGPVLHDIDEPADLAHLPPSLRGELEESANAS
ncbi:MAG: TIGR04282 family arsenosugar biosynthesis glycosyltransferase [Giesbergeria sp.]